MDFEKLEKFLGERGVPAFRMKQIKTAIFKKAALTFDEVSVLPKNLRDELDANFKILPFEVVKVFVSTEGNSCKALIKLSEGAFIETVIMSLKQGVWSACVSCQLGCAMKCAFCATGALGFKRNLSAHEIWGQVLFWNNYLRRNKIAERVADVVYMGMGEPFNNFENVAESIKVLTGVETFNMSERSISVSTSGVAAMMGKFGEMFPQANLALSLHSADPEKRKQLMPVTFAYDLNKIADGLKDYFAKCNRKVFIEYILLDGINDQMEDAEKLLNYLKRIGRRELLLVNLIVFNPVAHSKFQPSSKTQAIKFKEFLVAHKVHATIRKSLGQDIDAACGQLAAQPTVAC
ncbi:MAG: 23S rRNA (adenine(2503)-C(2))-methyltransferase RlmN [Candidatus Niyogibacteria bacterium]|nr:23S rRNA (adenine(2503)-C(2))-methyltransferase RlmN [Candidatus Niyogibacteria bacterium]